MTHPVFLEKAARSGRVRGTALDLLASMRADPARSRSVLSKGLRQARWLHSRERRLVGDGIRAVLERQGEWDARSGQRENDDTIRWVSWLVDIGLSLDVAAEEVPQVYWMERPTLDEVLVGRSPLDVLALLSSLPVDWVAGLESTFKLAEARKFVMSCQERAPVDVRVQRVSRDRLMRSLEQDGVHGEALEFARGAVRIHERHNLQALSAFKRGWFEVQDAGSQLVAEVAAVDKPGKILDYCAGAGGKSLALASMVPTAAIVASDIRERPLSELMKRARRGGLSNIEVCRNSLLGSELAEASQDMVLADVPCSGLGTLRRHPELRLRLSQTTLSEMNALQCEVLEGAARFVRPGGALVYATCSVLRAENEGVIEAFVAQHPEFEVEPIHHRLGDRSAECGDGTFMRVGPHSHGTDGLFCAVMRRQRS